MAKRVFGMAKKICKTRELIHTKNELVEDSVYVFTIKRAK